jgi:ubiquinone/menaquinone biosynthesis C-methylase UbiE
VDVDVHGGRSKTVNLNEAREFLKRHLQQETATYFGRNDPVWLEQTTQNWFDEDRGSDGRWLVIKSRLPKVGRVLDMAAGCGTFLLSGLKQEHDVWGVEPEPWKRQYFKMKVAASQFPPGFGHRLIAGVGEFLPFCDQSFDLVTSYQTLEHVRDVAACLREMVRVLKPGGILYLRAPDYSSFFEPHYMLPFLPRMNKRLAAAYVALLGRPPLGLQTLRWITEKEVIRELNGCAPRLRIERTGDLFVTQRKKKIAQRLPESLRNTLIVSLLNAFYGLRYSLARMLLIGRQEKHIDLWSTREG